MLQLKNLLSFIFNLFFPRNCISCNILLSNKYYTGFCLNCFNKLENFNIKQHSVLYKVIEDAYFDDFNARFVYNDELAKVITGFKFHDQTQYAQVLANLLTIQVNNFKTNDCLLVPVPVHTKRLLTRKYNQASLLAKYISKNTNISYSNKALKRIKHTPHQTGQSAKVRKKQLDKAFFANTNLIKNKDIILIDDVFTTGSTVNLCTKELKEKGAKSVKVITVAFTPL